MEIRLLFLAVSLIGALCFNLISFSNQQYLPYLLHYFGSVYTLPNWVAIILSIVSIPSFVLFILRKKPGFYFAALTAILFIFYGAAVAASIYSAIVELPGDSPYTNVYYANLLASLAFFVWAVLIFFTAKKSRPFFLEPKLPPKP